MRPFAAEAADALASIPHPFLAVVHLGISSAALPRPLRGFGHLVVPQEGRRILGAVWNSSLFSGRAPSGQELVTVFLGGARDPRAQELSDEELARVAAGDTASALEVSGRPELVSITRYARAIPQYVAGHEQRIATLARAEARWPGLAFLGNYRGGIAVGDVVRNASLLPKAQS